LLEGLKEKNVNLRRSSATILAQIEPVPESAVPTLRAALLDQDMTVRVNIAASLCSVPGQTKEAVAILIAALTNRALRSQAVAALAKAGPQAKKAIPALLAALQDENSDSIFADRVASTLEQIGGAEAADSLLRAFAGAPQKVRPRMIQALGQVGPAGVMA